MSNYWMKAWHTVLGDTVTWLSGGAPDSTGASSGYDPADLESASISCFLVVPTTGGTTPGEEGGDYLYPPMALDDWDQSAIDMVALSEPALSPDWDDLMGDAESPSFETRHVVDFFTGDVTELMGNYP